MAEQFKVVRIDGSEVLALPGKPAPELVEHLEKLLRMARDGEICGFVGALVYPAKEGYMRAASSTWAGYKDSYATVGALEDAKYHIVKVLSES